MVKKEEIAKPDDNEKIQEQIEKEIDAVIKELEKKVGTTPELPDELQGTTYYKTTNPEGKTARVYRIIIDNEKEELFNDIYDEFTNEWVDYPNVAKLLYGIGDPDHYIPIDEKEAFEYIKSIKKIK